MSILIAGFGNQGKKRIKYLSQKVYVADINPKLKKFKDYKKIPMNLFSSAFLCLPDKLKKSIQIFYKQKKKYLSREAIYN